MIENTPRSATFLTPGDWTAIIDTPEIMRKLKAAEPTIVEALRRPGGLPRLDTVSIMLSKISGALEPSAMSVRFAMVGFHTLIFLSMSLPS